MKEFDMFHKIKIDSIALDLLSEADISQITKATIKDDTKCWIGNFNGHAINLIYDEKNFSDHIKKAKFNFCDGNGLAILLWLLLGVKPKQVTYNRWFDAFIKEMADDNFKFFLLGDEEDTIQTACNYINEYKNGACVGVANGFFDKNEGPKIVNKINSSGAHILIVGMGMPRQEEFISRYIDDLNSNVIFNGGACFKFLTGEIKTCPTIISRLGFEWLYRMIKEPKRLWKRYIIGIPKLIFRLIKLKIFGKLKYV